MPTQYIEKLRIGAYREYSPLGSHSGIENVWRHFISHMASAGCEHRLIPEPTLNIALCRQYDRLGDVIFEDIFIFGPITYQRTFTLQPGEDLIAVRIAPEWTLPAFGFEISQLNDVAVCLKTLAPSLYYRLRSKTAESTHPQIIADQLLYEMNRALTDLAFEQYECLATRHIASQIRRASGGLDVSNLLRDTGFSERHIRRKAAQHLGMSPKEFSTSTRFLDTLRYADLTQKHNWADIAVLFGYFDQSHLINEFKRYTGLTPSQLLASRQYETTFLETKN